MNRRLQIFLTASVVLNLLFGGMLLGDVSHRIVAPSSREAPDLVAKLPEAKRRLFESALRPAWKEVDAIHAQMDNGKKEALRLLRAEPFSEEAYLTQIQHISDLHTRMKRDLAEAVADLARQFAPEERAVLAEIISRSSPYAQNCIPAASMQGSDGSPAAKGSAATGGASR